MTKSRKIAGNIAWMTIAEFATKGISFFTNAYLARVLMREGFGEVNFTLSFLLYFSAFVALGFNPIGSREVSRRPEYASKYVNNIISIRLILALIAFVIMIAIGLLLGFSERQMHLILIGSINLLSTSIIIDWYYQAIEKMNILAMRQLITSTLNIIGIFLLVTNATDSHYAVAVTFFSTFINCAWLLALYIKKNGMIKISYDKAFWTTLIKESIPLSFSVILISMLGSMNIMLLGILLPDSIAIVGDFSAAMKVAILIFLPISVIQSAFFPHFSRADDNNSKFRSFEKYLIICLIIGGFAIATAFYYADTIISIIYGAKYIYSAGILRQLLIWVSISYLTQTIMFPLLAWKREKRLLFIVLIGTFINLTANIILIPIYTTSGATWANIIAEFVMLALLIPAVMKDISKYPYGEIAKIALISFGSVSIGFFSLQVLRFQILGIIFAFLLYICSVFLFKIVTIEEIKGILKK